MKIIDRTIKPCPKTISELSIGDIFRDGDEIYMKIWSDAGDFYKMVDVRTGVTYSRISANYPVTKLNAELHILS